MSVKVLITKKDYNVLTVGYGKYERGKCNAIGMAVVDFEDASKAIKYIAKINKEPFAYGAETIAEILN